MSNKKRISKKIREIENNKLKNFVWKIEIAGKNAEVASLKFMNLFETQKSFRDSILNSIPVTEKDIEFYNYVNEIRKVTPLDDHNATKLCKLVPVEHRDAVLKLIIAGFPSDEAYHLIKETYKI